MIVLRNETMALTQMKRLLYFLFYNFKCHLKMNGKRAYNQNCSALKIATRTRNQRSEPKSVDRVTYWNPQYKWHVSLKEV